MQRLLFALSLLILIVFCVAPLGYLMTKTHWSQIALILQNPSVLTAVLNTLRVSFAVGMFCLLLGIPLAWLLTRTDFPLKKQWRSWLCLPYAIPPYIGAIGWIILANPQSGLLNHALGISLNIYSFWGLVWVETNFLFTFVLLTCLASLDRMDSSLEEAARLSGASPARVFFQITLPLLKPAIFSGFLLSFLATAASFGVPAMIGGPARIFLLTTQIYTYQKMGSENGLQIAIALSALLMLLAVGFLILNQRLLKNSRYALVSGKTSRPSLVTLGNYKGTLVFAVAVLFVIIFILPLGGILFSSLNRVQGVLSWDNFTFSNYIRVLFETEETARALSHSLILGAGTATLCCALAIVLSFIQVKTKLRGRNWIDIFAAIPYSTPGTVVALALILSFSQGFWGVGPSMYNSLILILIAYLVKFLSLGLKTTNDGYTQIHDSLVEAARVSGATWWQSLKTILVPLLTPSLISAWFLIFMPAVSELTMSILLTGPGNETVGTLIFQLQEYADIGGGGAAVLSVIVVLFVLLLNFLTKRVSQGKYGI